MLERNFAGAFSFGGTFAGKAGSRGSLGRVVRLPAAACSDLLMILGVLLYRNLYEMFLVSILRRVTHEITSFINCEEIQLRTSEYILMC